MHWFSWKRLCRSKTDGGLGFRDFEAFNLALLGKQAWRLFQKPDSMMAQVLKSKYYPHSNIFNAKQGRTSSYIWKSILEGRDLLKKGLRFEIGNGTLVHAWLDPWLNETPSRPPRKVDDAPTNLQVSDLFHGGVNVWDENKVRAFVVPEDVDKVLSINLSTTAEADLLGWNYTNSGIYSVRSAYHLAIQEESHDRPAPPPGNLVLKSKIWKLNTASKIKHFLWKIVSGSLPVGDTLVYRHIINSAECVRCCHNGESMAHVLFECSYAQQVWKRIDFQALNILPPGHDITDKLLLIIDHALEGKSYLPLWTMWRLWKARNVLIFQQKNISDIHTTRNAIQDNFEWNKVHQAREEQSNNENNGSRTQGWQRPPNHWIKINYDASWAYGRTTGAGWICRDKDGQFKGAGQSLSRIPRSPLEAELCALVEAMEHATREGFTNVLMEGDNSQIPDLIKGEVLNFKVFNWIRTIRSLMSHFAEIKFTWISRKFNKEADILSKSANTISISPRYYYVWPMFLPWPG